MSSEAENTEEPTPEQATTSSSSDLSEANIQKAIRFWRHPSLTEIPSDQKQQYLRERGVTDEEIHKAWERIAESEQETPPTNSSPSQSQPQAPPLNKYSDPYSQNTSSQQGNDSNFRPNYHQQPPPPYYGGNYPPQQNEEDSPLTMAQGASLVTLGGFIGLTAAAASRWLNGGDFQIFPKPRIGADPRTVAEQRSLFLQRLEQEDDEEDDEEEEDEDDEIVFMQDNGVDHEVAAALIQEKLLQQVESIAENLKANVEVQEKVLKKLSQGSSITDQSMTFLREQRSTSSASEKRNPQETLLKLWAEMVEIKSELRSLHVEKLEDASQEKARTVLVSLENCIDELKASILCNTDNPPEPNSQPSATHQTQVLKSETNDKPKEASEGDENKVSAEIPHTLRDSIRALAEQNEATALRVGCQLLYLYIINLSGKPDNPRYRKIFTCNESFQKVETLKGGKELLYAVGFSSSDEKGSSLQWLPDGTVEEETVAMAKLKEAASALSILKSGKSSDELTASALAVLSSEEGGCLVEDEAESKSVDK